MTSETVAEDRADVRVDAGRVEIDPADPSRIRIDATLGRVDARVPMGTDVVVGAGSAGWVHATVPRRRDTRLLGLTDRPILAWLGG